MKNACVFKAVGLISTVSLGFQMETSGFLNNWLNTECLIILAECFLKICLISSTS